MSHGLMPCSPPVNGNAFRENLKVAKMNKEVFDEIKMKLQDLTHELKHMMETHKKEIEKKCEEMKQEIKEFMKNSNYTHEEHLRILNEELDKQNIHLEEIDNREKENLSNFVTYEALEQNLEIVSNSIEEYIYNNNSTPRDKRNEKLEEIKSKINTVEEKLVKIENMNKVPELEIQKIPEKHRDIKMVEENIVPSGAKIIFKKPQKVINKV